MQIRLPYIFVLLFIISCASVNYEFNEDGIVFNGEKYNGGDTVIYIKKKFIYTDSVSYPIYSIIKNNIFYEVNRKILYGENYIKYSDDFDSVKYFIFKTRYGKIIEEGYYLGKGDATFDKGKYMAYYKNGNMFCEGYYINKCKNGEWVYFYNNGSIKSKGKYLNDYYVGKWIFYNSNGELLNEVYYPSSP